MLNIDIKPSKSIIYVLIPAFNEEKSLPLVLNDIPKNWVKTTIVCNNGSTDETAKVARENGAVVVEQSLKGYGNACLAGMGYLQALPANEKPEIVVFLDGDYSDYPEELPALVAPILNDGMDMVIGSRMLKTLDKGAMTLPQKFGNWLAPTLIRWLYGYHFTDLGPFRAIKWEALMAMNMSDPTYGWTVEMQIKAAKMKLKCTEIPVSYRQRAAGVSKVSGTVKGTFMAGYKIINCILTSY
jgi:glycosyltransferase involved in cell wall biosynthesis